MWQLLHRVWILICKVLKDISTGADNQTFCCSRIYGHFIFITFIGLSIAAFIKSGAFNAIAFCTGAGGFMSGQAIAIYTKRDTEPKPKLEPVI